MCSQMGVEPKISEMPIDLMDFPLIVRLSLDIFNRLGDRYASSDLGPIYIGKDLSTLEMFHRMFDITDKQDQVLSLQIIQHLDAKAVKRATDAVKKKSKELARKHRS